MNSDIIKAAHQSISGISRDMRAFENSMMQEGIRKRKATDAQIALPHLMSGDATFQAMKHAVEDLAKQVPPDHDVLILMDNLVVQDARFIRPHTFLFEGVNPEGHSAAIVCHFSQVKVQIVYLLKQADERFVTKVVRGFAPGDPRDTHSEQAAGPNAQ